MTIETIRIDHPDDPRVADYREIRERDLVGRRGLFVAEGRVVIDVMLKARRFRPESFLILPSRLAGMADILGRAPADAPVYLAAPDVIDAIAGFHIHRGVLAIGRARPADTTEVIIAALPANAIVVLLAGIANHDNVGAIFRNAAAFGADAVLLDESCCDPLYRKAIRVSVGNALRVPFAHGGSASAILASLAAAGFVTHALSPRGTIEVAEIVATERMALVLGTEGDGLPEALMRSVATARIDMAPGFDSLNVAVASAIALREIARGRWRADY